MCGKDKDAEMKSQGKSLDRNRDARHLPWVDIQYS